MIWKSLYLFVIIINAWLLGCYMTSEVFCNQPIEFYRYVVQGFILILFSFELIFEEDQDEVSK